MSKRLPRLPSDQKADLKKIAKAGFDYVQFSSYHYRIEGTVDFWPSSGKWIFLREKVEGTGAESLLVELRKWFPALAEASA